MSARTRATISLVLAITGAVLALVGGTLLYARQEIFEADGFADNSVKAIGNEQVRKALAEPITAQAIDRGPDVLINARPLLASAVEGALDSQPFRAAFRHGARKLHRAVFDKDREQIALTIGDANVLVADAVSSLSPKTGEKIPRDLGDRLVRVTDSGPLLAAVRASDRVRFLGIVLPILSVLCLAGAVAISTDRRRAVLNASIAMAAAAVIGFIALLIGRGMVLSQFEDDTVHDAVEATWNAFLGRLGSWMLFGGILSIVVAAAAAMARERDPIAPAKRVWGAISTPATRLGRGSRAVAIGAIGLLLVLEPGAALRIAAVFLGAYALFFAACELLGLIAPPEGESRGSLPSTRVAVAVAASMVLLVVGVVVLTSGGEDGRAVARPPGPVTACNGYAELCDLPLNEVAFPAAHNAMSSAEQRGWYQPNQRYAIERQLNDGVRALLIDSYYGIREPDGRVFTDFKLGERTKVVETVREQLGEDAAAAFQRLAGGATQGKGSKEELFFCHIVCELGAINMVKTLERVREFLDEHPDEFVALFIEDRVSPADTAAAFERSGLLRYAYVHKPGDPFPTLRELIESDRRLFVMAEEDSGAGTIPWYHQGFDLAMETPYTFHTSAELAAAASCVPNRGGTGKPLFQLNNWVEKLPRSPRLADRVNSYDFMLRRARLCEKRRGALPNLVAVDYYNRGDLFGVVRALNGIPASEEPTYRTNG